MFLNTPGHAHDIQVRDSSSNPGKVQPRSVCQVILLEVPGRVLRFPTLEGCNGKISQHYNNNIITRSNQRFMGVL